MAHPRAFRTRNVGLEFHAPAPASAMASMNACANPRLPSWACAISPMTRQVAVVGRSRINEVHGVRKDSGHGAPCSTRTSSLFPLRAARQAPIPLRPRERRYRSGNRPFQRARSLRATAHAGQIPFPRCPRPQWTISWNWYDLPEPQLNVLPCASSVIPAGEMHHHVGHIHIIPDLRSVTENGYLFSFHREAHEPSRHGVLAVLHLLAVTVGVREPENDSGIP